MKVKDIYMYSLGALVVIGFFALIYMVFFTAIPTVNKEIGLMVIGALVANFNQIVAYFFGSSKGSADKTEMMKK